VPWVLFRWVVVVGNGPVGRWKRIGSGRIGSDRARLASYLPTYLRYLPTYPWKKTWTSRGRREADRQAMGQKGVCLFPWNPSLLTVGHPLCDERACWSFCFHFSYASKARQGLLSLVFAGRLAGWAVCLVGDGGRGASKGGEV
jgi:hypothetical protein